MMRRYFEYMFELDEFVDRLVNNGHFGEFKVERVSDGFYLYW